MHNKNKRPLLDRAAAQCKAKKHLGNLKQTYGLRKDLNELIRLSRTIADLAKMKVGGDKW
jgi:hypothetical protein